MQPPEKEINDLKWLLKNLKLAEDYCRPYFDKAKRHYRLYRFASAVDEEDWPYVNRVRSRDILAFVEDSTALMIQTLFATMPFFDVMPRETSRLRMMYEGIDDNLMSKQIAECLQYQIGHEDTEFFAELVDFFKGGMIFGNSYQGIYPQFDEQGNYTRPLLKTTDFWDILPIPGGSRISRSRGVFVRDWQTIESLTRDVERAGYTNIDQIKSRQGSEIDAEKSWHKQLLREVGLEDYIPDENNVEIFHYFSGGHVITFADRRVILRDSRKEQQVDVSQFGDPIMGIVKPYPYNLPVVQYKYMTVPLEFFAMGIPEVLEVLQEDKNLIRSARRDNVDLVINKVLKARLGADINYDLIKYYAGAIWPLENLNDIEEMQTQDVTQSSYIEEANIKGEMENALSLFGYARGQTPEHSEQPTTVMKLQQASLNRLDLAVKMAEFTTLRDIATKVIMLTRRYMSQADYEAIIGDRDAGFYRLSEDDIKRHFHFRPVGSSITNIKELRQQQVAAAIQMVANIPPEIMMANVQPFTVDWLELLSQGFDAVDIKTKERILIPLSMQQTPDQAAIAQTFAQPDNKQMMMGGMKQLMDVQYGNRKDKPKEQ